MPLSSSNSESPWFFRNWTSLLSRGGPNPGQDGGLWRMPHRSVPAAPSGALELRPSTDYIKRSAFRGGEPAMARKPAKRTPERPRKEDGSGDPPLTDREKIVAAFLA